MEKVILPLVTHAPPQAVDSGPAFSPLASPDASPATSPGVQVDFSFSTGTQEEWNEAYARLADYFRALRIHSRLHRTYLILEVLRRAAQHHREFPDKSPTWAAMREARSMQQHWMRGLIGDMNIDEGRLDVNGRMAFLMGDGPRQYPHYFLGKENLPEPMVKNMRVNIEQSGPDMEVSSMVPRPIDLGPISEFTDDTIVTFERYPVLRSLVLLIVAALVIWGVWSVTNQ
jgi:hypothetical protein